MGRKRKLQRRGERGVEGGRVKREGKGGCREEKGELKGRKRSCREKKREGGRENKREEGREGVRWDKTIKKEELRRKNIKKRVYMVEKRWGEGQRKGVRRDRWIRTGLMPRVTRYGYRSRRINFCFATYFRHT